MNPDDLITLNEEIAGMARAGLPLDQGLAALASEMRRGALKQVTQQLAEDLRGGMTLPQALENQKGRVPPFYAGLVEAGIRSGHITDVLTTLAVYARTVVNLRTILLDAIAYPLIVLVFASLVFGAVVVFVIPHYDTIYRDFGMRLPWATEFVLALGRKPWELILLPALALVGTLIVVWFTMSFTLQGRRLKARFLYAIPLIGTVVRAARLASSAELLAILVDHQIPLARAFLLAGQASSDPILASSAQQVHDDLSEGVPLATVLRSRRLVPGLIAWMTAVGEQRGNLGKSLHQVAELYRRQVEMRASMLRSILPGFLIVSLAGVFVVFFVIVLMLPMVKLLEGLAK